MNILVDNIEADPKDFYALVVEEVEKRQIPDLTTRWQTEQWGAGIIKAPTEVAEGLVIDIKTNSALVLAYCLGRSFFIHGEFDEQTLGKDAPKTVTRLYAIRVQCFAALIKRCVKSALDRYLQHLEYEMPSEIDLSKLFVTNS